MNTFRAKICLLSILLSSTQIGKAREVRPDDTLHALRSVAMVACLKHQKEAPALAEYVKLQPDLVLWMGDNIYADTTDMAKMRKHYHILAKKPGFETIAKLPTMATWDDHDYGANNVGKNYPKREESKQIFMDFWKMPKAKAVRSQAGVYSSQVFGPVGKRVQVIMLDCRYSKTDDKMLSEEQWLWLGSQLEKPAEFRLLVSGQQVLVSKNTKFEAWSKVGNERQRLFDLIREKKTTGVVFLSGDQHYAEVTQIKEALAYDAWEFTFAGVNQDESVSSNDHRVGEVTHAKHKYGGLTFEWGDSPSVTFQVFDLKGKQLRKDTVLLSSLR